MTQKLVFEFDRGYFFKTNGIWDLVFGSGDLVFGISERTDLSGKMSDRGSSFSRTATRDSFVSDMEKQPRHRHSSFLTYFCILLFCILYFFLVFHILSFAFFA